MYTAEAKRPTPKHPAMEKPNLLFTHTESVAKRRQVVNSPEKSNLNCRDKASDFPRENRRLSEPISPILLTQFRLYCEAISPILIQNSFSFPPKSSQLLITFDPNFRKEAAVAELISPNFFVISLFLNALCSFNKGEQKCRKFANLPKHFQKLRQKCALLITC